MKRLVFAAVLASFPAGAFATELPLKRVVLSTSGLAQFTHEGEAAPGTAIELSVRLGQVDDILKSLTIFDAAGSIGAVSLAGKTPLEEIFRDLPFGQDALDSQVALFNALVGAEVEIEGDVAATGRIFRIEEETVQLPNNGGHATRHRLTILSDKGFVQAILEDVTAIRFTDAQTRAQIDKAVAAVAQNRAKDQRTISINLGGEGKRPVGLSYVVAAPVWKTAYRLVLPKEGGKARLQGWSILENLTGGNWQDVELTLISGNPVALKQALYTSVFLDRPEIPIASATRIVPSKDDSEDKALTSADVIAQLRPNSQMKTRGLTLEAAPAPAPPASTVYAAGAALRRTESMGSATAAPEAEEATTQVLYRFPAKITLASGSTMMVPFVDREIAATRTFLYQPETNAHRPLAAVRVNNDGDSALPGGLVTAFETGNDGAANFAGDAQLPLITKGASRFITFALDSKTDVRRADQGVKYTRLGKAVHGELSLTVRSRWSIDYEITPPADEDREVVVEEPRTEGWKAIPDSGVVEETPTRLRYKIVAPKGKTTKATLTREHVDHQTVSLTPLDPDRLLTTISGLQNEAPALKDAVSKLGGLVNAISKLNAQRRDLKTERESIGDDQRRIRDNLGAVGPTSDLGRQYLETLKNQEERLNAIRAEDKALEKDVTAKIKSAEEIAQSLVL